MKTLTQARLKENLHYNPTTGDFTWLVHKPRASHKIRAGTINNGYRSISIDGKKYLAHRLAWLYMYGQMPSKNIDHINNHPDDNRLDNLRECTTKQNSLNRLIPRNNTSGFLGVSKAGSRWKATLHRKTLGYFETAEVASLAYQTAAKEINQAFFNSGIRGSTTMILASNNLNGSPVTITKYHPL